MVKPRLPAATGDGGAVELEPWVRALGRRHPRLAEAEVLAAVYKLADGFPSIYLETGLELAALVAGMELDTEAVIAALFCRPARHGGWGREALTPLIGDAPARLAASVNHMADSSILDLTSSRMLASEAKDQTANIRRMLVAVIDDGRVAVLKLAERVVALRRAKASSEERKARIATEAMTVFVPLADRLGIWQLKWELEDLSLRYLEPDAYMGIAKRLDGRRAEREQRVNLLVGELQHCFEQHGLKAEIEGRAKHIYSIWRKMRAKRIPFDEVYDLQAVRVVVGGVAECYAALGWVHALWRHLPEEFDDYIAAPKENGYRSIHTAVLAADGRPFEVQIRTQEMHRQAELGVCAHWSYKGMDDEDDYYADKVAWLRRAIEVHDREGVGLAEALLGRAQERRVFVHTPDGQVLDLMAGATPVDFAYRVHTEVGHQCVGAEVDGRPAPLNEPLQSGQRVRVLTDPAAVPQRLWLDPQFGYVGTARAKSKIRAWFLERGAGENAAAGRALLLGMIDSLDLPPPNEPGLAALAADCGYEDLERFLVALGIGELDGIEALRRHLQRRGAVQQAELFAEPGRTGERHRLRVEAKDREGLLRDLTLVLSRFGLSMLANSARLDAQSGTAWVEMELELDSLSELGRVLHHLRQVSGVRKVRRVN